MEAGGIITSILEQKEEDILGCTLVDIPSNVFTSIMSNILIEMYLNILCHNCIGDIMKTITIKEEVWKQLVLIKINSNKKNLNDVIGDLLGKTV